MMLNEDQNNTVVTEIQDAEMLVASEQETVSEEESIVEKVVEEKTDSENNSAPENLSYSSSETDNLIEKEKLETEIENTILPNIYNGIICEDYVEKLIRLGDLYVENSRNKEAALYLRYFHYMVAKYVLEKKYEKSEGETDLSNLENFEPKYEIAREEYNKVRDNSLPIETRLLRDYIDSINSPIIVITNDTSEGAITLSINDKFIASEDSTLFFFPESDFYGELDKIELKTYKTLKFNFRNNTETFVNGVDFKNGRIILSNTCGDEKEDILTVEANTIILNGCISSSVLSNYDVVYNKTSCNSTESYYIPEIEELELEFSNNILPDIYWGIDTDDNIKKIISLGDFYAENSVIEEASIYLQYYYYMVAKYAIEQKYKNSTYDENQSYLNDFEEKYTQAQRNYQKLRNNKLPQYLRLVKEVIENCKNQIIVSQDKRIIYIVPSIERAKNSPLNSKPFFFPESDFYGRIERIILNFPSPLRIKNTFCEFDDDIHILRLVDNHIVFLRNKNNTVEDLAIGIIDNLSISIYGEVPDCVQQYYPEIEFHNSSLEKTSD